MQRQHRESQTLAVVSFDSTQHPDERIQRSDWKQRSSLSHLKSRIDVEFVTGTIGY
jgi:predicted fused transcriptional regulator/phosphomethylpyrimidine kinase